MKKIFKFLPVLFLSLFMASCDEYEAGSDFVEDLDLVGFTFQRNTFVVSPDEQEYDVRVSATKVSSVDRTFPVTYVLPTGTPESVFTSIPTSVTIPAGQLEGTMRVSMLFSELTYRSEPSYGITFNIVENAEAYTVIQNKKSFPLSLTKYCEFDKTTLNITFDQYSSETGWYVVNLANPTVQVQSGSYTVDNLGTASEPLCLAPGDYRLTMTDAYGDGFCCDYGDGEFSIVYRGTTLATGTGQFGAQTVVPFTIAE